MIKKFLVNRLPFLGNYKRLLFAMKDSFFVRETYSQHQEDLFIYEFLKRYNLAKSIYVDIGANHPTDISNTYLLYKNGFTGVVIEPNQELIRLFKLFRKKDIALCIGCSDKTGIMPFYVSKTPVLSTFQQEREVDINTHQVYYVPIMKLDDALSNIPFEFINLLSIDVEGINYEVLLGAQKTIEKSLLICIEYDKAEEKEKYVEVLGSYFELIKEFGCNLLFVNTVLSQKFKK